MGMFCGLCQSVRQCSTNNNNAKLWDIGVRGTLFKLLAELSRTSQVRVQVGTALSLPFELQRGLRQGCPL